MSQFHHASQFHDALQATLVCPKCHACNRPLATLIELSADRKTAYCGVCSRYGDIDHFLPKEQP